MKPGISLRAVLGLHLFRVAARRFLAQPRFCPLRLPSVPLGPASFSTIAFLREFVAVACAPCREPLGYGRTQEKSFSIAFPSQYQKNFLPAPVRTATLTKSAQWWPLALLASLLKARSADKIPLTPSCNDPL